MPTPEPRIAHLTENDRHISCLLFCVLLGVYLLVYASQPTSIDGAALLASATTTIQHGSPDIAVIGASEALLPPVSRMGTFGDNNVLYSKKGPTPSLFLLPFVAVSYLFPWLSAQATAMLFNPIVLALTAVLLYVLLRRMGYDAKVALLAALVLGLATFTITYTKTLFGEPLAGLLLLAAILSAHAYRETSSHRLLVFTGTALGLAAGINLTYALMATIFGLYLFGWKPSRWPVRGLLAFAAPIAVALLLLGAYNWIRFDDPLSSGYNFDAGEGFNQPLLTGLYGMFLSPYRGLLWYNPILLLAIPGWLLLRRTNPQTGGLALALVLMQALTYASWWSWHGGVVWGPRFLIPVTPLVVIFTAPVFQIALSRRDPGLHIGIAALSAISVSIQALGSLYNLYVYMRYLISEYGSIGGLDISMMTEPGSSAILGHMTLVKVGWRMEPAWLAQSVDPVHLLAALAVGATGFIALSDRLNKRIRPVAIVVITLISLNVIVARQQDDELRQQVKALEDATSAPTGTLVAATTRFGNSLIDIHNGDHVLSLNAQATPDDPLTAGLWDYALQQGGNLWFVTWFPPNHPDNWQERALWENASFASEQSAAGHRVLLFKLDPSPVPDRAGGWRFGPILLDAYGITTDQNGIRVSINWSAPQSPEQDYTWFVHLVDQNGAIVAQQDRAPWGGSLPTSAWVPGATVQDRLFFPFENPGDTSKWQIRVGYIDPSTGQRLPAWTSDGKPMPDEFVLLPLHVQPD